MLDFYRGKKVFITGHTGFKGAWLSRILINAGAVVTGYSLKPPTDPSLFEICRIEEDMNSVIGDIRDIAKLERIFRDVRPEIVIHLAAQPLVRESYADPRNTFETNVMGTVNILECVRKSSSASSFLNVTTDKVYQNNEWVWGYRESDPLDGYDPYSNSKSCSELVTHSYSKSFFSDNGTAVSTARAGNVIGGGDFARDRIIPDCVRAAVDGDEIIIRNPYSTRPYQHVLEPLNAYLMILRKQYEDSKYAGYYNIGPDDSGCISTGKLADMFCSRWEAATGRKLEWSHKQDAGPHESNFLKLDCSKLKTVFGWKPSWNIETAVDKTVEWTKAFTYREDVSLVMGRQWSEFLKGKQ